MKTTKRIATLTATAKAVSFPIPNPRFIAFKDELRALLRENFGAAAVETLTFDERQGVFLFTEEENLVIMDKKMEVKATETFEIDPHHDLLEEFKKVEAARTAFRDRMNVARQALIQVGGKF